MSSTFSTPRQDDAESFGLYGGALSAEVVKKKNRKKKPSSCRYKEKGRKSNIQFLWRWFMRREGSGGIEYRKT
jgi:hypothetical protein